MGQASGLGAIQIIARGIPLTLIGATSYYNSDKPNEGLLVLASSPYKTAKDLEGQTMASVALQNMNSIATLMWLSARGVDVSTIKSIEVPVSASLAALEQNRIAATQVYEPFYSAFIATGKVRVLGHPYGAVGKRYADALLMADSKWATDNAAVVGRFLRVLQEASAYVTRHETETAPLLVQFAGLDPNGNLNVHHSDRGVTLVPGDVQPLIDAGYKFKAIPKMLRAEDLICTCALRR
jgi:ABC-type nitrate/sulfonate/bicarbonate transport system substrate-binding protein